MLWGASLSVPGLEERHHVETPRQALKKTRNGSQSLLTSHPSSKQKKARDKGPCLNQEMISGKCMALIWNLTPTDQTLRGMLGEG